MAYAPSLAKKWYEDLSVEELEKRYEELKVHYCFNSKEEQINYIIKNYLSASLSANVNSTRIALEELLKEKTGKDYKIEPKKFEITLKDIIDFIANPNTNLLLNITLFNFFNELIEVNEKEKINFLLGLIQEKSLFNEFTKEIEQLKNISEIYERYKKLVYDYIMENSIIG